MITLPESQLIRPEYNSARVAQIKIQFGRGATAFAIYHLHKVKQKNKMAALQLPLLGPRWALAQRGV